MKLEVHDPRIAELEYIFRFFQQRINKDESSM